MPEVFADDRDICAFLFLGQKSTAANWANPKDIEIVRRYPESRELDGITEAGQGHGDTTIGGKTVKDRLAVPVLKEARRRTEDFQGRGPCRWQRDGPFAPGF